MKPLAERQATVEQKIASIENGPRLLKLLQDEAGTDRLKRITLCLILGRDMWHEYWAVLRDSIEAEAEEVFARAEVSRARPPSIFGGGAQ
jgi:hypothetical protein